MLDSDATNRTRLPLSKKKKKGWGSFSLLFTGLKGGGGYKRGGTVHYNIHTIIRYNNQIFH